MDLNEEEEIRAITDREQSQGEEENEGVFINDNAILFKHSAKEEDYEQWSYEAHTDENSYTKEEIDKIILENKKLKENEAKYQEHINTLKDKMKALKRKLTDANSGKVKYFSERSDLEEFFLNWIEEVRKDITKRKLLSEGISHKTLNRSSTEAFGDKKISLKDLDKKKTKLENFTKTDKRKVIELLISNEQVLLFLYERLFPYQTQRPQSVKVLNSNQPRPTSSQPSLTTAPSYIPQNLLNNQPRFLMEDGTSIATPNKMDARFLPNQMTSRSKTAQGSSRVKLNTIVEGGQSNNMMKGLGMPFPFDTSTSTLLENNRQRQFEYSNYFINRRFMNPTEDENKSASRNNDYVNTNFSVQNNIGNVNLNINLQGPQNLKSFIPPKASIMQRTSTAPGDKRSISMKQLNQI